MKALTITIVAALTVGGGYLALAQQGTHDKHHAPTPTQVPKGASMAMCKQMMAAREKHMEEMKAMDAKLDTLVARMDRARGSAKADATAAVVKQLVANQRHMPMMMMGMNSKMMGHMMQHSEAGKMADCPMMKGMMGHGGK